MSIAEKAMVVNLTVGLWQGYRLDKEASRKVVEDNGAAADAARVNKHLVPKEALKEIVSTSNAVRSHFYDKTLPWKDNGDRLLTRMMYMSFIQEHERLVTEFHKAVDRFLTKGYVDAVEQAGFRMGELFDPADYPPPAQLKRRFYIDLSIDAVTTAGDFRVEMDEEDLTRIRQDMTTKLEQQISGAMQDVWERLAKVVGHMAEKLGDEDKIFRNSTITNLEELVDALPALNVLGDKDLERMQREIKVTLCGHDPDALRKDSAHRAAVAGEAKRIMDGMASFMGAFQKEAV